MISHVIDEATRFSSASIVPARTAISIIFAIDMYWIRFFAPPNLIVADGEAGLDSEEVRQWPDRLPLTVNPKAPGEKATAVERDNQLLRRFLHRVDGDLQDEGIIILDDVLLAECIFTKNSMLTIGNSLLTRRCMGELRLSTKPSSQCRRLSSITCPALSRDTLGTT